MARGIARDPAVEAERCRKIREARARRKLELGYINSPETRAKIGRAGHGRVQSLETKAKRSAALKGRRPSNIEGALAAAHAVPKPRGPDNPNWKGDAVGYGALHGWVKRVLGRPSRCERCGRTDAKRYEWANKSRLYRRDVTDWERLCTSCHRQDGYDRGEYQAWNKGIKTGWVPRSAFKKGERTSVATEFQKGQVPHNKHLTERPCAHCGESFQPLDATRKYCGRPCYWASMREG